MKAAGHTGPRPKNVPYRLSRLSVAVFPALFLIGVAAGAVDYARRSPAITRHTASSNAITIHVVLALAAAAAVAGIQARRPRRPAKRGPSPWAAPFSASAAARLGRTIRFPAGLSLPNVARVINPWRRAEHGQANTARAVADACANPCGQATHHPCSH